MTYLRKTLPHFALGLSLFPSVVVGQASTGAEANTDVSLIASPQSTASVNAGGPQLFFTGGLGAPADYGQPVGQSLVQIALDRKLGDVLVFLPDDPAPVRLERARFFDQNRSLNDLLPAPENGEGYVLYWTSPSAPEVTEQPETTPSQEGATSNTDVALEPSPTTPPFEVFSSTYPQIYFSRDGHMTLTEKALLTVDGAGATVPYNPPIQVCIANCDAPDTANRTLLAYGRKTTIDPLTGALVEETLIAYSQAAFEHAIENGFSVILEDPNIVPVFSFSVPERWAITGDAIVDSQDRTVIEAGRGGAVNIAGGALIVRPAAATGLGGTSIASSDGVLLLGDGPQHRTIVQGTLEIQDPTQPNHAATKRYVDGMGALGFAMSALPVSQDPGTFIGFASGSLGGETAFAFGLSHTVPERKLQFRANVGHSAVTGVGAAFGVGIGF